MGFKLFDQVDLSTEDMGLNEPLDIDVVIATQEAFADIADIEREHENTQATIALADTVTSNLEAQVAHESAVLAKPESITAATVILSQESLVATAKLLGAEDTLAGLSVESMEANPVTSLELSIEEKQGLIKRVIETIKVLFKKFVTMFKKLYTKALVAMTGIAKQAEALEKEIKETKDGKDVEVKDGEKLAKLINAKLGAVIEREKASGVDKTLLTTLMSTVANLGKTGAFASATSDLVSVIEKSTKDLKDEVEGKDLKKIIDDMEAVGMGVLRVDGNTIKKTKMTRPEVDEGKKYTKQQAIDVIAKVSYGVESKKAEEKKGLGKIAFSDLAEMAKALVEPAKGLKKFAENVDKSIENASKTIEKLKEGEDDKKYLPATKMANVMIANVGIDMVLGYIGAVKGSLAVVTAAFKEAKNEDKKEDKK